jgi:hypothetical protein
MDDQWRLESGNETNEQSFGMARAGPAVIVAAQIQNLWADVIVEV